MLWGQLEPEEEPESDEEDQEEQDDDEDMEVDEDDAVHPSGFSSTLSGLETPSMPLLMNGADTPDIIQLRKEKTYFQVVFVDGRSKFSDEPPKKLYQVLQSKDVSGGGGFMGSQHVYDMSGVRRGDADVEVNPDDIEGMNQDMLKRKYEEKDKKNSGVGSGGRKEDLSDMVNEHSSKTAAKKKEKTDKKKEKDYKF